MKPITQDAAGRKRIPFNGSIRLHSHEYRELIRRVGPDLAGFGLLLLFEADPSGHISATVNELADAVGWEPEDVTDALEELEEFDLILPWRPGAPIWLRRNNLFRPAKLTDFNGLSYR